MIQNAKKYNFLMFLFGGFISQQTLSTLHYTRQLTMDFSK